MRDIVLYWLAECHYRLGEKRQALVLFRRVAGMRESPLRSPAARQVADCLLELGQAGAALAAYRQLLATPQGPDRLPDGDPFRHAKPRPLRLCLADALAVLGRRREATQLLGQLYLDDPAHSTIARAALVKLSRQPPAISDEDRLRRARALHAQRLYEQALAELAAIPPAAARALGDRLVHLRGLTLFRLRRDYAQAATDLLGVWPRLRGEQAAEALFLGARALSRVDRDDQAIALYGQLVKLFPRSRVAPEAQFLRGWLELNRGRFAAAVPHFAELRSRYPASYFAADARFYLAFSHYLLGDLDSALRELPGDSDGDSLAGRRSAYWRARILSAQGRRGEALRLHDQLFRLQPLTYYGLLSRARLGEAQVRLPLPTIGQQPATCPPPSLAVLADRLLGRSLELLAAGIGEWAGPELRRIEPALLRRHRDRRGLLSMLALYQQAGEHARARQLAEAAGGSSLGLAAGGLAADAGGRCLLAYAYPHAFRELVETQARPLDVPPLLVYAVMRKESGYARQVVSPAGAVGLLQVLPETAARIAGQPGQPEPGQPLLAAQLLDPEVNLRYGVRVLGQLRRRLGGQLLLVAAAYNAGPRPVLRWLERNGSRPADEAVELWTYAQTREYAKRVLAIYSRYLFLDGGGLPPVPSRFAPLPPLAGGAGGGAGGTAGTEPAED